MKEWAKKFYNSKRWGTCREKYISKRIRIDGGMCEECGEELGYIVHHKINLTSANINDPLISLNSNLLMYVCKHCHDRYDGHFIGSGVRVLRFDENGDVLPWD